MALRARGLRRCARVITRALLIVPDVARMGLAVGGVPASVVISAEQLGPLIPHGGIRASSEDAIEPLGRDLAVQLAAQAIEHGSLLSASLALTWSQELAHDLLGRDVCGEAPCLASYRGAHEGVEQEAVHERVCHVVGGGSASCDKVLYELVDIEGERLAIHRQSACGATCGGKGEKGKRARKKGVL